MKANVQGGRKMQGKVISDVVYEQGKSKFCFQSLEDDSGFDIVNDGREAIKDYLFVRQGQTIQIDGEIVNNTINDSKRRICISSIKNIF